MDPNALEQLQQEVARLSAAMHELQGSTGIRPEVLHLLLQRCAGTPYIPLSTIERVLESAGNLEAWMHGDRGEG